MEPVFRSRDVEKLSVKKLNSEFRSKHEIKEHIFDSNGRYIPSKEYIRNKKNYVMEEEKLKNRNKSHYSTARKETNYRINKLMNKIEMELFRPKT